MVEPGFARHGERLVGRRRARKAGPRIHGQDADMERPLLGGQQPHVDLRPAGHDGSRQDDDADRIGAGRAVEDHGRAADVGRERRGGQASRREEEEAPPHRFTFAARLPSPQPTRAEIEAAASEVRTENVDQPSWSVQNW